MMTESDFIYAEHHIVLLGPDGAPSRQEGTMEWGEMEEEGMVKMGAREYQEWQRELIEKFNRTMSKHCMLQDCNHCTGYRGWLRRHCDCYCHS